MAKVCEVCGKKPGVGNKVSHAHNLSKRRWYPNLQSINANVEGKPKKMKVCTSCIQKGRVERFVKV